MGKSTWETAKRAKRSQPSGADPTTGRLVLGSDSHHDEHQVVGQGRDGDEHKRNSFDQVSADLKNRMQSSAGTGDEEAPRHANRRRRF